MRCCITALLLLLTITAAAAKEQTDTDTDWTKLFAGALTTLAIHEGAHYALAKHYDFSVSLDGTSIIYPNWQPTNQQRLRVSSVGFQAQWLASEFAFHRIEKNESNDYYKGIIWGHIAISLAYISLKNDSRSDLYAMAQATSRSDEELLAGLLLTAGLDSARLMLRHPPKWLKHLSFASKGLGIAAVWQF